MVRLAAILMVKNEESRIGVTIDSLVDKVDGIIVYDTGSIDKTLDIIREKCEKASLPLDIKIGEFTNYGESFNVLLDFADEISVLPERNYEYVVMIEANDEYRGDRPKIDDPSVGAYYVKRVLQHGSKSLDTTSFWNVKLLKVGCGMRNVGRIHEYLREDPDKPEFKKDLCRDFVIFQNKHADIDDRTTARFPRDKALLGEDLKKDPTNTRLMFYYAQTCNSLRDYEESYEWYEKRSKCGGYGEEVYYSCYQCGVLSEKLKKPYSISHEWYTKAYELDNRAEPLVELARINRQEKKYAMAYIYANLACCLKYPNNSLLFVSDRVYEYLRWHELSISAWYVALSGKLEDDVSQSIMNDGYQACKRCIELHYDDETNLANLKYYEDIIVKPAVDQVENEDNGDNDEKIPTVTCE